MRSRSLSSIAVLGALLACGRTQFVQPPADCPAGQTGCDGACALLLVDSQNCGFCDHVCASGTLCDGTGTCATSCAAGFTRCSGPNGAFCAALDRDPANCGACGASCPSSQICQASQCACPASVPTPCGSGTAMKCTDLTTDPSNCGACGHPCAAGQTCTQSQCG